MPHSSLVLFGFHRPEFLFELCCKFCCGFVFVVGAVKDKFIDRDVDWRHLWLIIRSQICIGGIKKLCKH